MNELLLVFLFVSLLLNALLFIGFAANKKGINFTVGILRDIRRSGFNRRIHTGTRYKSLEELGTELNILMDRFQSTLEEKEKLELSHKQLIANISHDIRTPLTSLLGFVEVLKKGEGVSPEQQREYLEIIDAKGQSLYRLIQEFFELSKLESEDTVLRLERLDLAGKTAEILASFYQDFVRELIMPEIELPEKPVYVWGDGASVERVLQNLISNALKYGTDGRSIGVSLREEGQKVWVDVWDRGKGIPQKDLPLLFNRLYTAETSRNGKMRGSGLGLAIAQQLVAKQNGEIQAASIPGDKTTFSFCLRKAEYEGY